MNHSDKSDKSGLDYCKRVDCRFSGLTYTPNQSDGNVICTDGKDNYWKHQNPEDITFTLTANMGKKCTEQDCFNVFDSLDGLTVEYSNIGSEGGQCKLESNCGLLKDWGTESVSIANIYNLNGIITENDNDCITNRGSCKYLQSGRFCAAGSLDGKNCLKEEQNSVEACPKAVDQQTGFPFNIKCEQPHKKNATRRFYCKTTDDVEVNSGFGNGCCSFGNIVITDDDVSCQKGYFGRQTWDTIYKMWGDNNWNEGKNLRVLNTGVKTAEDGRPSRNLIILKNTKTGNYLNIDNKGKLCETNGNENLNLYYINNAETGTKFGKDQQFEVRFGGKQGINPHSFLAGRSKENKVQGVVSNNAQDPSKKGDIGFLTVDDGKSLNGRDYPIRLIINQNDETKCVLAAFHISSNNDGTRFLENGLNNAKTSSNDFVRLGRVEKGNYVRFNVYWSTEDTRHTTSKDFAYPNRAQGKVGDPFWDLSASAEYEIVAALRENYDEFMVNQFRGELASGLKIDEEMSIGKIIEGKYQIRDVMDLLQKNLKPDDIEPSTI